MAQLNQRMVTDLFDLETHEGAVLWRADQPESVEADGFGDVWLQTPFIPHVMEPSRLIEPAGDLTPRVLPVRVRAYGDQVVRITFGTNGSIETADESEMLQFHADAGPMPLAVEEDDSGMIVRDPQGRDRLRVDLSPPTTKPWSDLVRLPTPGFRICVRPDGVTPVAFHSHDQFFPKQVDSMGLGFMETLDGEKHTAFSLKAGPQDHFVGTGERFGRMDLAGSTLNLINDDGLGVNTTRTYKNTPFFLCSAGYGLMVHTSAAMRLSLAGVSTRAAQGVLPDDTLDLWFIGGGSAERILYGLRSVSGFPADVPAWSYGTWMSRMTYFTAKEVTDIAHRMRDERLPCDVLHIDTGWFAKDWVCEWEFSQERFSDPVGFMKDMDDLGYKVTLWQTPNLGEGNKLLDEAKANRYLAPRLDADASSGSDFSSQNFEGVIDFTNPAAVSWYQGMLKRLLDMGASAIKTDFGENVDPYADYHGLSAKLLRNRYALLYQKAAFEATAEATPEPIIWARAGWLGCQRYPVHWGGDCACTWDGMAGSLRGGLHLGLSGYAFWSHDVPGFHGLPDFMNSWPDDDLYVRWTQFGVFTSHLRYHGTSPREPYEYPEILPIVRRWLRLRYALIPYLAAAGTQATQTGFPVLRAMLFGNENDSTCWHIDDQFFCGDELLVAPVMNDHGCRDVYLPSGEWVDFWTGNIHAGSTWLRGITHPLETCPVFIRRGAILPVWPEPVLHTGEIDLRRAHRLQIDDSYEGLSSSVLGRLWSEA